MFLVQRIEKLKTLLRSPPVKYIIDFIHNHVITSKKVKQYCYNFCQVPATQFQYRIIPPQIAPLENWQKF